MTTLDETPETTEEFAQRVTATIDGASLTILFSIGHQTGLFDAMAQLGPSTSAQIAEAAISIRNMINQVPRATTVGSLLGIEGNGSAAYFGVFNKLLRDHMNFTRRRRRPKRTPASCLVETESRSTGRCR